MYVIPRQTQRTYEHVQDQARLNGVYVPSHHLARSSDPETSKKAAREVTQKAIPKRLKLLREYRNAGRPLIDEDAGRGASVTDPWKRCSELRKAGLIVEVGRTKKSSKGKDCNLCEITDEGYRLLRKIDEG